MTLVLPLPKALDKINLCGYIKDKQNREELIGVNEYK
jgi:hypothetical protein